MASNSVREESSRLSKVHELRVIKRNQGLQLNSACRKIRLLVWTHNSLIFGSGTNEINGRMNAEKAQ